MTAKRSGLVATLNCGINRLRTQVSIAGASGVALLFAGALGLSAGSAIAAGPGLNPALGASALDARQPAPQYDNALGGPLHGPLGGQIGGPLPLVKVFMSPNRVERDLRDRGYSDFKWIDRWLPGYVVEVCRGNDRLRLRLNRNARIKRQERLGSCGGAIGNRANDRDRRNARRRPADQDRALRPADLRPLLRARGFSNIQITDRNLPGYGVEACRGSNRVELRLNRFGDIRQRSRIGSCDVERAENVIRAKDLRPLLRSRGFSRIDILDRSLPRFVATGCKGNRRLRVVLDRFGSIIKQRRVGTCRAQVRNAGLPLSEIREILRNRRYYNIRFTDRELPGYAADACRNVRRFRLRINRNGQVKRRKAIGWCTGAIARDVRSVLPRRISTSEIDRDGRLQAEDCQDYLESLLEQGSILFDVNSSRIGRESYPLLRRLARTANRCPDARIEVAGHTDSDGSRSNNQDLSERRARAVVQYLNSEGVSLRRLSAVGYGEERPVASNATRAEKALNRRIEFVVDWDEG